MRSSSASLARRVGPAVDSPSSSPSRRQRSIVLDQSVSRAELEARPPNKLERYNRGKGAAPGQRDRADANPYLKMLSTPLRRCLLTQKVLPTDLMLSFRQFRTPPPRPASLASDAGTDRPRTNLATSNRSSGLTLLPNGVLHPRFEVKAKGKGAWVVCNEQGVRALAEKGSYKRVNPSLSTPPTEVLVALTETMLVRRVAQEVELYLERIKSWNKDELALVGMTGETGIVERVEGWEETRRRIREEEATVGENQDKRIRFVLDLSTPQGEAEGAQAQVGYLGEEGQGQDGHGVHGSSSRRAVLVFRFGRVVFETMSSTGPAPSVRSTGADAPSDRTSEDSNSDAFLRDMRDKLDGAIGLFARRAARQDGLGVDPSRPPSSSSTSTSSTEISSIDRPSRQSDCYIFYSPIVSSPSFRRPTDDDPEATTPSNVRSRDEVEFDLAKAVGDVFVSLWRVGLWRGEGWRR